MRLKFLQWNVWYPEKVDRIVALLKDIDADVLCLQELTTNCDANPGISTGHHIAEALGFNWHIETAQRSVNRERDSIENGIFSRYPLRSQTSFHVLPPGPPDTKDYSREGRVYLQAQVDVDSNPVTIATTHLSYSHRFEGSELKEQEMANLLGCMTEDARYIFSGDLNATPGSDLINRLCKKFVHCGPPFDQNTWTTKPFGYNGFKETELNWRLDYVFCTKDLTVKSAEIISTEVSDHLPMLVEFEIN